MNFEMELSRHHEKIVRCVKYGLVETRTQAVPGEGPVDAALIFIGEALGMQEDTTGSLFVVRAGKLLDGLLDDFDLRRGDVFGGNVLKRRFTTPSGEDGKPRVGETSVCTPHLDGQMEIIIGSSAPGETPHQLISWRSMA